MRVETRFTKLKRSVDGYTVGLLAVLGTAYGIATRTPEDYLTYPVFGAGLLYLILAGWMLSNFSHKPSPDHANQLTSRRWFLYFVAAPAVSALCAVIYYGIGVAIKDSYLWAMRPANSLNTTAFAVGFTALAASNFLFLVRLRFRFVYGLSEAIVGCVVAVYKFTQDLGANNALSANTFLVVLTAGVYLMVRGLDNMHIGLTKEPLDPLAAKVTAWLFGPTVEPTVREEKPKNSGLEAQTPNQSGGNHSRP